MCSFFLFRVHCIAHGCLNFSRSVEKSWCHFCHGFRKLDQCFLFYLTILLVLEWNLIFQRSCLLSLIVEMKSERYLFWKRFWKSSFFDKKIQHTSFKIYNPLIVLYFENWNWPVARLKWLFFSWFFVSILNSDFGYIFLMVCGEVTFCGFQETRCSSQNLRLYQERLFLFFSTNFINMHNNQ
jgi:hypothetical protein